MNTRLDGRRALVCGASRGIGRAVALALAESGADVVAVARDNGALAGLLNQLAREGSQTHQAIPLDLSDGKALSERMQILAAEAPVQIVINNTGGPPAGLAIDAGPEQFEAAFAQHVLAAQRIIQSLLPGMKGAGYGRIINIISTSVKEPIPGLGVSNTVRGAMASWSKTLARELGRFAITVNNVLPGFTATKRLDYIFQGRAEKSAQPIEIIREQALSLVPAGRFAEPAEIADAVAFLASPAAAYINGINLPVDGGRTGSL